MAGGKRHALGQHFLVDQGAIQCIIKAAQPVAGQILWEIGVGDGALTEPLLAACPASYRLFELDGLLLAKGRERWPNIEFVPGDAVASIPAQTETPDLVVGNLPYSAATAIWRRFCAPTFRSCRLVLMFQKEVADRLLGSHRAARGPMAVLAALLYELELVVVLPPQAFAPRPKVDSAVLAFVPEEGGVSGEVRAQNEAFFLFLTQGFHARRKTLDNNLRALGIRADQANIDGKKRPEMLSAIEWWQLFLLYQQSLNCRK